MAKEFKLEITFNAETKDCRVTGPVNEPELCALGMELARRVIEQHNKRRTIVPVTGMPKVRVDLPNFRNLLKGG